MLPPLVGTLAVAREPLTPAALADLLARRTVAEAGPDGEALVRQALAAIGTLVRRGPTPEGEDGFTLFHHSFRAHVLASARTKMVVATAREALAEAACAPGAPQEAAAARYLFRHGVGHLVEAGRAEDARALLTEFAYVMARLQALQPGGADGLQEDWQTLVATGLPLDRDARLWEAFVRERGHLLRRGTPAWPAYKILLQLAVEHADDSPVTQQAEAWVAAGRADWLWLRNPRRVAHAAPDPCLRVLEGHEAEVHGARVLADGRILSWSRDGTLRLWTADGAALAALEGHAGSVLGAMVLQTAESCHGLWTVR